MKPSHTKSLPKVIAMTPPATALIPATDPIAKLCPVPKSLRRFI